LINLVEHSDVRDNHIDTGWIERHLAELTGEKSDHMPFLMAALAYFETQANTPVFSQGLHRTHHWLINGKIQTYKTRPIAPHTLELEHHLFRHTATIHSRGHCQISGLITLAVTLDSHRRWIMAQPGMSACDIALDGVRYDCQQPGSFTDPAHAGQAETRIKSPLPGKVVRVCVSPGQSVQPKDPLVIVEAMKMEHTLTASLTGTIKQVACVAGETVQMGQVLVELEATQTPI
jgi:acetyl/propionyl-CoA carboxylase alpha subunit